MVSIVLPTYNGASGYLDQAIQSCLDQTYTNWELIIVDDASTDDTPGIINRFSSIDKRIQYLRHASNKRLPGALNTGFSNARGDYLTWTSDDNCYRTDAIKKMVTFLLNNSEIGMVYTNFSVIDEQCNVLYSKSRPNPSRLIYGNCLGPCFLYRRIVHNNVGEYDEKLFLAEDWDYWLRVSSLFKIQLLSEDLYLYRMHSNSLTSKYEQRVINLSEFVLAKNLHKLNWANPVSRGLIFYKFAKKSWGKGDLTGAIKYFFNIIPYSPYMLWRFSIKCMRYLFVDSNH